MSEDRANEHQGRGRGVYPHAGVEGLSSLNSLHDFRVVDGESDIRGWDVVSMDSEKAGKVHDLLVDTAAMKVRYLDVELDKDAARGMKGRHVLVPIGMVQLDDDRNNVRLGQVSTAQLAAMPLYDHNPLTREQERDMLGHFGAMGAGAAAGMLAGQPSARVDDFYGHPHFDESGLRRTRETRVPGTAGGASDARPAGDAGTTSDVPGYITRSEE